MRVKEESYQQSKRIPFLLPSLAGCVTDPGQLLIGYDSLVLSAKWEKSQSGQMLPCLGGESGQQNLAPADLVTSDQGSCLY